MDVLPFMAVGLLALLAGARGDNGTEACGAGEGPWAAALQAWALAAPAHGPRHGRVMSLPPAPGYYVSDRADAPPPPGGFLPAAYDEWTPPPAGGKIVNRPGPGAGAPYKEKPFKPSPAYPSPPLNQIPPEPPSNQNYQNYNPHRGPGLMPQPGQQGPSHQPAQQALHGSRPQGPQQGLLDRVDEPPRKQVTETDLYLLGAIEKLVYRVDLMEKRLRKMEENVHYLVAGAEPQPEPCVANFTRVAGTCYHVSEVALDWKSANLACRKLRAHLLELGTETERRHFISAMLADKKIRGLDVWTGGLNPGLLWIWAQSARPVLPNATAAANATSAASATIAGEGRCLALLHDPAINYYVYRGQECAFRHRYVCEQEDDRAELSNHIARAARARARTLHSTAALAPPAERPHV